jgi:uncharacterized protein
VNVLIVLFDESHEHHDLCLKWCERIGFRIAICPIVENGLLRICSHPSYPNKSSPFKEIQAFLFDLRSNTNTKFIADNYSFSKIESFQLKFNILSKHITDAYLLYLADQEKMFFSTLDGKIPKEILGKDKAKWIRVLIHS